MKYAVVYEKSEDGFGAYVPDLPGCVALADTLREVEALIKESVSFHIEGMREDGIDVPEPTSRCDYIAID